MPEILIQDCLDGSQAACAALFERYKALVYRTAYLMLGNGRDAEDALQDVFSQVFRALHTYDAGRAAFSTWLHRVTVNTCLGRQRKRGPGEMLPLYEGRIADHDRDHDPAARLSLSD